ncbi:TIGR00730 family Rossman fold protein [Caenimonas aquaedulcis]|uniref:Cytokinin riboside 5'-monophosphate phosphoribohydrolase n=1 Tax=Caenimonas aquaedulcis TaxID=2793270 RepID=A0A931MGB4_9BURK|nr:TIGR00730 family Rossman fold protein [Caenimonas aquaedulcis]MBG9387140.1 TIGR00730 family Rossman fold protein [Caenimonas aquaedulcis]
MTPFFSLCVYCGSRPGVEPAFAATAAQVGRWLGEHGGQLVYGGGNNGLMGVMATAALEAGARVVGVIPHALVEKEWAKLDCTELHVVENMHERKRMMAERADAFLALPGGIGTFEEFFEVWTWRQLGYHDKPIGLLNEAGYYDTLLAFLWSSVSSGFMSEWQMELIRVAGDAPSLLQDLRQASSSAARATNLSQI